MVSRKLSQLEQLVIDHVDRYRLTVPSVVGRLVSPRQGTKRTESRDAAKKLLANLSRRGVLASHEFPSRQQRFYTLAGAKVEPSAVDFDLAILWWCMMSNQIRRRVSREELVPLFGDKKAPRAQFRHCIAETSEGCSCLYRMYPTTATRQQIALHIRKKHLVELRKLHSEMVACGDLGLAVLVGDRKTQQHLEREIKRTTKHRPTSFIDQARIVVDVVPNSQTIDQWARE